MDTLRKNCGAQKNGRGKDPEIGCSGVAMKAIGRVKHCSDYETAVRSLCGHTLPSALGIVCVFQGGENFGKFSERTPANTNQKQ